MKLSAPKVHSNGVSRQPCVAQDGAAALGLLQGPRFEAKPLPWLYAEG